MEPNSKLPWYRTRVAQCAFIAAVIFHFTFAPRFAFSVNLMNDEGCYVSTLYKLLLQSSEGFCAGRTNYFAPGAPFLWLPAGWLALALSSISQLWLFHWLQPIVALYSFSLFGVAMYFLFWSVQSYLDESPGETRVRPWFLTVAILLNSPILYYAGKWAIMPHTAQLLAACVTVYLLDRRRLFVAGLAGLLLSLTRFNDVPVLLMIVGKAWDERESWRAEAARFLHRKLAVFLIVTTFLAVVGYIGWTAFVHGYGPSTLSDLFLSASLPKLRFFLFHDRWGVFWMTPWWVVSIALGIVHIHRLSWFARGALGWLLVEAFVATSWGGNGGDFGYRYLIGSFAGAWVVWREVSRLHGLGFRRFFYGLTFVGAFWMTYLNLAYRATPVLSPTLVQADGAPKGVMVFGGLSHFQIEALRHFFDPAIYRGWFNRDLPLVQLYTIWFELAEDEKARGTDQLALGIATLGSFFYLIVYARRTFFKFEKRHEKKNP